MAHMYARNHVIYLIPLALGTTEMPIIYLKIKSLVFSGIRVRRKGETLQTTHTHQSLTPPPQVAVRRRLSSWRGGAEDGRS